MDYLPTTPGTQLAWQSSRPWPRCRLCQLFRRLGLGRAYSWHQARHAAPVITRMIDFRIRDMELEARLSPGLLICGARIASCICGDAGHSPDTPHTCYDPRCNGSWLGSLETQDFRVIRFPRIGEESLFGGPFGGLLGLPYGPDLPIPFYWDAFEYSSGWNLQWQRFLDQSGGQS